VTEAAFACDASHAPFSAAQVRLVETTTIRARMARRDFTPAMLEPAPVLPQAPFVTLGVSLPQPDATGEL
jgi:hypothetical protein